MQTTATFVSEVGVAGSRHTVQTTATFVLEVADIQTTATFVLEVAVAGSRHADYSYLCVRGSSSG